MPHHFGLERTIPHSGYLKFNDVGYYETRNLLAVRHNSNDYYPSLYLVTAHCEQCGSNSSTNGTIINEEKAFNIEGNLPEYHIATMATGRIPTIFDEEGTIWEHGGNTSFLIKFTIAYHGIIVADQTIGIPFFGTKSTSVEIDGVTFSIRTGPKKVSIKASTFIECDMYGTVFGCSLIKRP